MNGQGEIWENIVNLKMDYKWGPRMLNLPGRKLPKSEVGRDYACRTVMACNPKIDRATQTFLKFNMRH